MKIELTVITDIFIDENSYPNIAPKNVLDGVTIQNSDIIDGFEITTNIPNLDNTKDFFFTSAKITKRRIINDKFYFLVHRKSSDTWHIGYADNSDAGMISLFPTNIPETYKSRTAATNTMHCLAVGSHDKKSSDIVYEIDKLFDKAAAIAFVKRISQDKSEENQNENNPC